MSWSLLGHRSRRRYVAIVIAQMATGLLDLLGVALIGLMGLVASTVASGNTLDIPVYASIVDGHVSDPLHFAALIGIAAAVALLSRSLIYGFLLRVNYRLLARCQLDVTATLLGRFVGRPITDIQERSSQAIAYALTGGASAAITGLLGSVAIILTDCALLVLLGVGLLLVNPTVTLAAIGYLGLVAAIVHMSLTRWSAATALHWVTRGQECGGRFRRASPSTARSGPSGRLGRQYEDTRVTLEAGALARGTQTLIGQVPKVIYDSALVVGAVLLVVWQLGVASVGDAMTTLLLFLAAASRVIPSLLRVNGQLVQLRSYAAQARQTYALAQRLNRPSADNWRSPSLAIETVRQASVAKAGAHLTVSDVAGHIPRC